jgi:hypothetical protein
MDISKLTQEDLDKLLSDKSAAEKLAKEQNKKLKEIESQTDKITELEEQKAKAEAQLYKKTLAERTKKISKWLQTKNADEALYDKIGKMEESEFELFIDGKTDESINSKEEIDTKKQELEAKATELEKNKEKIRKEAMEEIMKKEEGKDKVIPPNEAQNENIDSDGNEEVSIAKVKEMYHLDSKPFYTLKSGHEKMAEQYIKMQDYDME